MSKNRFFNHSLMSAVALGTLAYAGAATAQEAPRAGAAIGDDIVVTAQRREQRLQDVPVAVTALSSEAVERSGLRGIQDIQYLAPAVQYRGGSSGGFQIRGVGTQGFDYSLDKSVGVMIDGVVQGIPRDPLLTSLTDIAQVEILRGPQGTLFGKNTSAGVIVITTRRPELGKWGVDSHITYGTGNERLLQGNVNIPVGDTLALRLSAHDQHRDGYAVNRFNNYSLGEVDDWGFRGKLLWQPTDAVDVYVIGSYQKTHDSNNFIPLRSPAPGGSVVAAQNLPYGVIPSPDNEDIADDVRPANHNKVWGVIGTIDYRIGEHTLTSVTAYRKFTGQEIYATDSTPVNYIDTNIAEVDAKQFTQELRLTSPSEGFLTYVFGLYYFDAKTESTQLTSGLFGIPPAVFTVLFPGFTEFSARNGQDFYDARTKSYAAFGQADFHVTDQLTIILGGRYTRDKVRSIYRQNPIPGQIPSVVRPDRDTRTGARNFSFRTGLQYKFTPDIMAYATYSKGYKGPAVANLAGEALLISPEKSNAFEVGLKTELFERKVTLNIAGFYQKYRDFQAQVYDTTTLPAAFRLGNAGGLETKGFEVELSARPTRNLALSGAVTYAPARFTDYITACYAGQQTSPVVGQDCYTDPGGARIQNLKGKPLNGAPDWSFTLGANYKHPLQNNMQVDIGANYVWRGSAYSSSPDPNTIIKSYGLLGANIGVGPEDGRWRVGLFARNLLDKHFPSAILSSVVDPFQAPFGTLPGYSQTTTAEARRTVGLMLDLKM